MSSTAAGKRDESALRSLPEGVRERARMIAHEIALEAAERALERLECNPRVILQRQLEERLAQRVLEAKKGWVHITTVRPCPLSWREATLEALGNMLNLYPRDRGCETVKVKLVPVAIGVGERKTH